ncbi:MAG TPA: phage terminase large subunit [Candidatus Sulfotelmatobacter sp.]|nr:phage terminase large subunit [Candidatus Sulfotelmatobacter sp.]
MPAKAQTLDISRFYKPSEKQKQFHSSKAKYRLYGGAKGGGKTAALVWEAISTCLRVPKCNVLILRRTFPQLEAGALSYFIKFVPDHIYGGRKNFNQSKYIVRFPNGSTLWFRPCQQENDMYDYQGHEYVQILIDESTEFTYKMFDFFRKQLRYTYAKNDIYGTPIVPNVCLATNPGEIGHKWHKCLFIDHVPFDEMDAAAVAKYDPSAAAWR